MLAVSRHSRSATVTIPCPYRDSPDADPCGQPITVTMSPYRPSTHDDPPEGPDLEDVSGPCPHADMPEAGEMLYDSAIEALDEASAAARDAADDQRIHLMIEGDD